MAKPSDADIYFDMTEEDLDKEREVKLPKAAPNPSLGNKKLPWIFDQLHSLRPAPGQQYRESTVGKALIASMAELIAAGKMTQTLADRVLIHFDVHVAAHLSRCGIQASFVTTGMEDFKNVGQLYDFLLKDVEISTSRGGGNGVLNINCDKVIVKAVPSAKLLKKAAMKKNQKGDAYEDLEKNKKRKEEKERRQLLEEDDGDDAVYGEDDYD